MPRLTRLAPYGVPMRFAAPEDPVVQPYIEKSASDTLGAGISEDPTNLVEYETTDALRVTLAEAALLLRVIPFRSDTLTPGISETASVIKGNVLEVARTDALAPGLIETAFRAEAVSASDSLAPSLTEAAARTIYSIVELRTSSDTLAPQLLELRTVEPFAPFVALTREDTLACAVNDLASVVQSEDVDIITVTLKPTMRIDVRYE